MYELSNVSIYFDCIVFFQFGLVTVTNIQIVTSGVSFEIYIIQKSVYTQN